MKYFVNAEYLKKYTNVTQNVGEQDLYKWTITATHTYVRPIMGYNFLKEILTKYNNNTLNTIETELVTEFIQPLVAQAASIDITRHLTFRLSDKGIQVQSGEFSNSIDIQQVNYTIKGIQQLVTIYSADLFNFLELNKKEFPLYISKENDEIVSPKKSQLNPGGLRII